jgi:ATP-dependent DNA helicase RecQ
MFREGMTLADIARARGFVESTVSGHLAAGVDAGERLDWSRFFTAAEVAEIKATFERVGGLSLTPVFEALEGRVNHGQLRLFRSLWLAGSFGPPPARNWGGGSAGGSD